MNLFYKVKLTYLANLHPKKLSHFYFKFHYLSQPLQNGAYLPN